VFDQMAGRPASLFARAHINININSTAGDILGQAPPSGARTRRAAALPDRDATRPPWSASVRSAAGTPPGCTRR
jgi:hypothetical protein